MKRGIIGVVIALFAITIAFTAVQAEAQLVTNGGFETGDFTGWTVVDVGEGNFYVYSGTLSPLNSVPVAAPPEGTYAAITDMPSPGTHIIYQDVALPIGAPSLVPTMNEWGLIIFMVLAGLGAAYFLLGRNEA